MQESVVAALVFGTSTKRVASTTAVLLAGGAFGFSKLSAVCVRTVVSALVPSGHAAQISHLVSHQLHDRVIADVFSAANAKCPQFDDRFGQRVGNTRWVASVLDLQGSYGELLESHECLQ